MTSYTEDDLREALAEEAVNAPPPIDVWPTLRRRVTVRRWRHTAYATGLAAAAAATLVVVLPGAHNTSRLTISQGASVTWSPDHPLSQAQLEQAAGRVRARLGVIGVSHASVATHDGALVVHTPRLAPSLLDRVMSPGRVELRAVYAMQTPGQQPLSPSEVATATLAEAENAYAQAECPAKSRDTDAATTATSYLIACSTDGSTEYLLGPTVLGNADISAAQADQDTQTDEWLVLLSFTSSGARTWESFTADTATKPDFGNCGPPRGCNAIGIVVDGTVLSAPRVQQPGGIRGGQVQITGALTEKEARLLAAQAGSGPLPTGFTATKS